jgi:hypothetical protein
MKDGVKFIKDAYYTLLDGAVTYNGSPIPVYDEESDPAGNDYYIIVSTVTDTNIGNKHKFFNETTVLIDVITKIDYTLPKQKEIVDVITGKVLNLVIPSVGTTGLTEDSNFQIVDVRKETSYHFPILDTGSKKIVRRLTRFSQTIIEK